jgi:signal peptide peptidase SppA
VNDTKRDNKPAGDREQRRGLFQPSSRELLAIDPRALAVEFSYQPGMSSDRRTKDGIAIISIQGPLEHHESWCWESFESILCRVEAAMSGQDVVQRAAAMGKEGVKPESAKAVILCIDSPGGEAAGAMETHHKLRRLRKKYKCPLYAYSNELAASAAYAVASACDEIWLPDTGVVGSIGVIATLFDRTQQNRQMGLDVRLITSGKFKSDNHADRILTGGIQKRMQGRVDDMAQIFFALVAKARGGTPEGVASLEAATFMGKRAIAAGLADGVMGFDGFCRLVSRAIDSQQAAEAA